MTKKAVSYTHLVILLDQLRNGFFISFSKRFDQRFLIQIIPSFSVDEECYFVVTI